MANLLRTHPFGTSSSGLFCSVRPLLTLTDRIQFSVIKKSRNQLPLGTRNQRVHVRTFSRGQSASGSTNGLMTRISIGWLLVETATFNMTEHERWRLMHSYESRRRFQERFFRNSLCLWTILLELVDVSGRFSRNSSMDLGDSLGTRRYQPRTNGMS